jgi:hypothetical protein
VRRRGARPARRLPARRSATRGEPAGRSHAHGRRRRVPHGRLRGLEATISHYPSGCRPDTAS